jgi:hypothetical protein
MEKWEETRECVVIVFESVYPFQIKAVEGPFPNSQKAHQYIREEISDGPCCVQVLYPPS